MLDTIFASLSQVASIAAFRVLYALSTIPLTTLVIVIAAVFSALTVALTIILSLGPSINYSPKPLLTGWERRSLVAIRRHLPPGWDVAFQVRAADAVHLATHSNKTRWRAIRRLGLRSLDFVLIDRDAVVRAVIELDDASHRRPDRRKRDADIDHVFSAAGIPVEHVLPHPAPHWPSIIARLSAPTEATANTSSPPTNPAPRRTAEFTTGHHQARRQSPRP